MENYIKTYESFVQDFIRSANKKRLNDDNKFIELFQEIIEDFEEFDKDLRKVSIIDSEKNPISLHEIRIGKSYILTYNFGKFHYSKNNPGLASHEHGSKSVRLLSVPFIFTLKKDELEKAFNTSRFRFRNTDVTVETVDRLDGKPNRKYDTYKISYDVSDDVFDYFIEEWNIQHPEGKDSNYKKAEVIDNIKKGDPFIVKYISIKNKKGDVINWGLYSNEDEKEMKDKLYNMSKEEVDQLYKERQTKFREKSDKIRKKKRDHYESAFKNLLKKHDISFEDFRLTLYGDDIRIEVRSLDQEIESKIEKLPKDRIEDFELETYKVSDGYKGEYKYGMLYYERKD